MPTHIPTQHNTRAHGRTHACTHAHTPQPYHTYPYHQPLYVVADLLLQLVSAFAHNNNRTWQLRTTPNIKLPGYLFRPLPQVQYG